MDESPQRPPDPVPRVGGFLACLLPAPIAVIVIWSTTLLIVTLWFRFIYSDRDFSRPTINDGMFRVHVETFAIASLGCLVVWLLLVLRSIRQPHSFSAGVALRYAFKAYAWLLLIGTIIAVLVAVIYEFPNWKHVAE